MRRETPTIAPEPFLEMGYPGRARREAGAIRFLADGGLYLPEQVVVEGLHRGGERAERVTFALYSPKSAQRAILSLPQQGARDPADAELATRLMAASLPLE